VGTFGTTRDLQLQLEKKSCHVGTFGTTRDLQLQLEKKSCHVGTFGTTRDLQLQLEKKKAVTWVPSAPHVTYNYNWKIKKLSRGYLRHHT
jgi:hypothetical protein